MENEQIQYDFFISYRREGSADFALLLFNELKRQVPHVFFDSLELKRGNFETKILHAIENSKVFLPIISLNCFERCSDPDDWFRREIAHALKCQCTIIPILMPEAFMPKKQDLPEEIREIVVENAVYYHRTRINSLIDDIFDFLHNSSSNDEIRNFFVTQLKYGKMTGNQYDEALKILGKNYIELSNREKDTYIYYSDWFKVGIEPNIKSQKLTDVPMTGKNNTKYGFDGIIEMPVDTVCRIIFPKSDTLQDDKVQNTKNTNNPYIYGEVTGKQNNNNKGSFYTITTENKEQFLCTYADLLTEGFRTLRISDRVRFIPVYNKTGNKAIYIIKLENDLKYIDHE